MKEINDLPIELYSSIFKYLSIKDLFNCRLVNKQFKCSTYGSINKLIVGRSFDFEFFSDNSFYYNYNELINEDDLISFKCYRTIRSSSIFNLKASLKYLIARLYDEQESFKEEFVIINEFINLESLELYIDSRRYFFCSFDEISKNIKIEINLKNLKYFKLETFYVLDYIFELNTPELKKIKYFYAKKLHIKSNPDSIKHLIVKYDYEDHLKIFKNLEIIEFQDWNVLELNENFLSFFKNLKQLKFNFNFNHVGEIDNDCFNEEFIQWLIKIFNSRIELNKDIDIYLYDVKLIDTQQLIDTLKLEELRSQERIFIYQINNYDLLESTKNIWIFNHKLYSNYPNMRDELPASFFDKYQKILIAEMGSLMTKNKNKMDLFVNESNWFLNNLKCLSELRLLGGFNQNFFNNLPNSIRRIWIKDMEKSPCSKINFNFILKLNRLREFVIKDSDIDLFNILLSAFLNLNYFEIFEFTFKGYKIQIIRSKTDYFLKYGEDDENFNFRIIDLDYYRLAENCNKIRSEIIMKKGFLSKVKKILNKNFTKL